MEQYRTDFLLTLEQLTNFDVGDPEDPENAPTPMIQDILRSWKKPMCQLTDWEIGELVVQHDGFPYVLDLVWSKLESNPLFEGGHYPGDVLSLLIRAEPEIWVDRPKYKVWLGTLYQRALDRPLDENDMFRETLDLPSLDAAVN